MVGTRSTSAALAQGTTPRKPNGDTPTPTTTTTTTKKRTSPTTTTTTKRTWSHAPSTVTLTWLAISLPLVIWDTGYVLGRPHTMPGGWAHSPLWTPYELYGRIDGMYGFKQWDAGNGFTAAQGWLNALETAMYLGYAWLWYHGGAATGLQDASGRRRVAGRRGAYAVLVGFSAAVMTLSKTVLYWLNEAAGGFDNIGHNTFVDLVVLWIIPKYVDPPSHEEEIPNSLIFCLFLLFLLFSSQEMYTLDHLKTHLLTFIRSGAWLVFSTVMIFQFGADLIDAVVLASGTTKEE